MMKQLLSQDYTRSTDLGGEIGDAARVRYALRYDHQADGAPGGDIIDQVLGLVPASRVVTMCTALNAQ